VSINSFTFDQLRAHFVVDGKALTHPDMDGFILYQRDPIRPIVVNGDEGVPYALSAPDLTRIDWRVV